MKDFSSNSGNMAVIESLSAEIHSALNKRSLRSAYQQPRFGDRLYGYQELVMEACSKVLRYRLGDVYYFDGSIWKVLPDIVLESALNKALVKGGVSKSDLVNARSRLMHSARGGASMSPLHLSACVTAFRNGVWDFSDVDNPVRHDFSERMPVVRVLPYDYDPGAVCPMWRGFLSSILPSGDVLKLQKFLGLGCVDRTRMTSKVETALWLIGSGANGKSTIFDVVRGVYGADNLSYAGLDTLIGGSPEARARFIGGIAGKLFNYCSEVQAEDMTKYADTFKALCSGEPQTIRKLGCNPETAFDIPFLIFNMNRRPVNRKIDNALMRRLLIIPFRTTVSAEDMNAELGSQLQGELSGIRNWMLEGYRMLVRDNFRFTTSKVSDEQMTDYLLENGQTVQVFLQRSGFSSNRRSGHWEDRMQWVSASELYADYVSFCERWAQEPDNQRAFGGEMTRLGWNDASGNRKRTSAGYLYGIFCDDKISYALDI